MELISYNRYDLSKHCGHIVLLYLDTMEEKILPIKQALELSGYVYYNYPISITEKSFSFNASDVFDNCGCLICVFSEEFFKEKNVFIKNQFFYNIGYVCGLSGNSVIPYCLKKSAEITLEKTPIQKIDFITSTEKLLESLNSLDSSKLLKYNFYSNHQINKYATARIFYRCLHLKFKIYSNSFNNAKNYYKSFFSRNITDSAFDEFLAENLVCGSKIVSFGNDKFLTPQMIPYKDEIYTKVEDYPQIITGKKTYTLLSSEAQQETGVRAELTMDILMPVHKILGSYFKCYISSKEEKCPIFLLLTLFEGDFTNSQPEISYDISENTEDWLKIYPKSTHVDKENNRFYFSVGMLNENDIEIDASLNIGSDMDYMFPQ